MEQQTTSPQPAMPPIHDIDEIKKNLTLLAIFHYILGGFCIFFGLLPLIHITLGILALTGVMPIESEKGQADERAATIFGIMFLVMGSIFFILAQTLAILILTNGGRLKKQRRYVLTLVTAALECMMFPLGTILGIFTIIIMTKPQAKALFEQKHIQY